MCITLIFFIVFVDREHQDAVCGSPVTQFIAGQGAFYFQVHQKDGFAHIYLRLCAKGFFQQCGQRFCLAGVQAFELADLAVKVAVAQKLAQGKLL